MGTVYRATDEHTGATVAVKVPLPHLAGDAGYRERLRREAQLAAALTSPRIVRVIDLAEHDDVPFMVMEFVSGETLDAHLRRLGPLPVADAMRLLLEVARALESAHALGIVHRDLKPQNVMLVDGQVKVLDFGIARAEGMAGITVAGTFVGTPAYSAPERASGAGDIRSDIYSAGVLGYALLAGHPPFDARSAVPAAAGRPLPALPDRVPSVARRVITRCLEADPGDRYQNPAALVAALSAVLDTLDPGSAPLAPPPRSPAPPPRSPAPPERPGPALPARLTSFVGRERELADVVALLRRERLLTLTGPGGAGKTRLALEVAALTDGDFPDGVRLVELAPLADPDLVPQAVAAVLGVREGPGRPLLQSIAEHLRDRRVLLVLDNCEHLVDAWAFSLQRVLQSSPGVRVLATSRQALGIPGEVTWLVAPLPTPPAGTGRSVDPRTAAESAAVRLFVERARAARPGFALNESNVAAVIQICQRLDGLPLALELAAARIKLLAPEQIAARLDDRFRLLTGGSRTAVPHHQTLLAAVEWSYELLGPAERALFARLAVFAGGFTLDAAEAVGAAPPVASEDVLDLLTHLVDRSLVLFEPRDDETRYHLLETLRDFGLRRLAASGDEGPTRSRHAAALLDFALRADGRLNGPHQAATLKELEAEHDNLSAALRHLLHEREGVAGLRLAGALARFWDRRGHLTEGRRLLDEALALTTGLDGPDAPPEAAEEVLALRARALNGAANLAHAQGDFQQAIALHEAALALRRRLDDSRGVAASLYNLALAAGEEGDFDRAAALHAESLTLRRRLGDRWGTALSLASLGLAAQMQGEDERAVVLCREGLAIARSLDDSRLIAYSLLNLGRSLHHQGDVVAARGALAESLERFEGLADDRWAAYTRSALGLIDLGAGDLAGAGRHFRQSLVLLRDLGEAWGIPLALEQCAAVRCGAGDWNGAARLFGAADARRRDLRVPLPPRWAATRAGHVAAARAAAPSAAAFAAAWEGGARLSVADAVGLALETPTPDDGPVAVPASPPVAGTGR
jgi:non-specific serine/threonine protein kinase